MLAIIGHAKEPIISFEGKPIVIEKEITWTKQFHQQNSYFYKTAFSLISNTKTDQDLILQFSKTGIVRVQLTNDAGFTQELVTGSLLPLKKEAIHLI